MTGNRLVTWLARVVTRRNPDRLRRSTGRHASVYVVSVDGGEHALIAESLGQVPGGEEGAGIAWSPDGTRLVVLADKTQNSPWSATLYVMNADGSERLPLAEAVLTQHVAGVAERRLVARWDEGRLRDGLR